MALLYLVSTSCSDLTTELALACNKLPISRQLNFLSYLHSSSVQCQLLTSLPRLRQAVEAQISLFDPDTGRFLPSVQPVKLAPLPAPELAGKRKKEQAVKKERGRGDSKQEDTVGKRSRGDSNHGKEREGDRGGRKQEQAVRKERERDGDKQEQADRKERERDRDKQEQADRKERERDGDEQEGAVKRERERDSNHIRNERGGDQTYTKEGKEKVVKRKDVDSYGKSRALPRTVDNCALLHSPDEDFSRGQLVSKDKGRLRTISADAARTAPISPTERKLSVLSPAHKKLSPSPPNRRNTLSFPCNRDADVKQQPPSRLASPVRAKQVLSPYTHRRENVPLSPTSPHGRQSPSTPCRRGSVPSLTSPTLKRRDVSPTSPSHRRQSPSTPRRKNIFSLTSPTLKRREVSPTSPAHRRQSPSMPRRKSIFSPTSPTLKSQELSPKRISPTSPAHRRQNPSTPRRITVPTLTSLALEKQGSPIQGVGPSTAIHKVLSPKQRIPFTSPWSVPPPRPGGSKVTTTRPPWTQRHFSPPPKPGPSEPRATATSPMDGIKRLPPPMIGLAKQCQSPPRKRRRRYSSPLQPSGSLGRKLYPKNSLHQNLAKAVREAKQRRASCSGAGEGLSSPGDQVPHQRSVAQAGVGDQHRAQVLRTTVHTHTTSQYSLQPPTPAHHHSSPTTSSSSSHKPTGHHVATAVGPHPVATPPILTTRHMEHHGF